MLQQSVHSCIDNPKNFVFNYCKTVDAHDDAKSIIVKKFPERQYIADIIDLCEHEYYAPNRCGQLVIPKSRQVMISWTIDAYLLWRSMFRFNQIMVIQSKTENDSILQLDRVKNIYRNLPKEFSGYSGLVRHVDKQAQSHFKFSNGSIIYAVPEGGPVIRGRTPTVSFMDEVQTMTEAEDSYANAFACCKLVIIVGTPGPGWFQKVVEDTGGDVEKDLELNAPRWAELTSQQNQIEWN